MLHGHSHWLHPEQASILQLQGYANAVQGALAESLPSGPPNMQRARRGSQLTATAAVRPPWWAPYTLHAAAAQHAVHMQQDTGTQEPASQGWQGCASPLKCCPHHSRTLHSQASLAMAVVLNSKSPLCSTRRSPRAGGQRSHAASCGHGNAGPEERRPHNVLLVLLIRNA
jgi:hypothetical protein